MRASPNASNALWTAFPKANCPGLTSPGRRSTYRNPYRSGQPRYTEIDEWLSYAGSGASAIERGAGVASAVGWGSSVVVTARSCTRP